MGKEWVGKRGVRREMRMWVCARARVEVRVPILKEVFETVGGERGDVVGAEECTERERSVEVRVEPAIVVGGGEWLLEGGLRMLRGGWIEGGLVGNEVVRSCSVKGQLGKQCLRHGLFLIQAVVSEAPG